MQFTLVNPKANFGLQYPSSFVSLFMFFSFFPKIKKLVCLIQPYNIFSRVLPEKKWGMCVCVGRVDIFTKLWWVSKVTLSGT